MARMGAKRCCGGGSWVETPWLSGSGRLRETIAVKAGGERGRRVASAGGKWSPCGLVLGWEGWWAVMERVAKVREAVSGVTV